MKQYIHHIRTRTKRALIVLMAVASVAIFSPTTIVSALPQAQKELFQEGVYYYDYNQSMVCSAMGVPAGDDTGANTDHSGKPILNESQFASIAENQPAYQQAAEEVGVPWAMIAAVHLMESNLARANPGKNLEGYYDGVYQFRTGAHAGDASGSKYPPGAVTQEEFLKQTIHAAEFLKSKATANSANNRELTVDASPEAVKDTFFGYNGRAPQYYTQAERLGYTREQGYEGSVYVMNMADAARDPSTSNSWKLFDGTTPSTRPGAFVIYSAIAGISIDNNCSNAINGTVRQKVVALAKQELDLWTEGQLKPGDYTKYTGGVHANWCAYFASWIYNEAGYPIDDDAKEGRVGAVIAIKGIGEDSDPRFSYHTVLSGYTPKPGDLVIQRNNASHVNIVIAVEGNTITVIGGNQGGSGDMNGYFTRSSVTQYEMNINHPNNSGFVSPD